MNNYINIMKTEVRPSSFREKSGNTLLARLVWQAHKTVASKINNNEQQNTLL